MSVEITDDQDVPLDRDRLQARLAQALERAGRAGSELSILLTDDDRMAELNRTYRGIDNSTDVLSFPQEDSTDPVLGNLLGDVVISIPTAFRQAGEAGISLDEEIENLALHGLLHLLGHDHEIEGWERWDQALMELRDHG